MTLQELMQRAGMWRGGELPPLATRPTGFEGLDAILPGGGWPRSGLIEILTASRGIGALRLVLPMLAAASRDGDWLVWVDPPHIPYAPALDAGGVVLDRVLLVDLPARSGAGGEDDEILWACEQALRFADCAVALMWLGAAIPTLPLRRLQLAAEAGATTGIVFRPAACAAQSSPAVLRLALGTPAGDEGATPLALEVEVLKARGTHHGARCRLDL